MCEGEKIKRFIFKAFESSDSCEMHSFPLEGNCTGPVDYAVNPGREITRLRLCPFLAGSLGESRTVAREMRDSFLRKREVWSWGYVAVEINNKVERNLVINFFPQWEARHGDDAPK